MEKERGVKKNYNTALVSQYSQQHRQQSFPAVVWKVLACTINGGKCTGARQWTLCKRGRSQVCICVFVRTHHLAWRCIPQVGSTLTQLGHKQEKKRQQERQHFFRDDPDEQNLLSGRGGIANKFKPRGVVRLVEFAGSVLVWTKFWRAYVVKCQINICDHMVVCAIFASAFRNCYFFRQFLGIPCEKTTRLTRALFFMKDFLLVLYSMYQA